MLPLTNLKSELKLWEAKFKAKNDREPTKADIKAVPLIAEKYKLYNKSKSNSTSSSTSTSRSSSRAPSISTSNLNPSSDITTSSNNQQQQQHNSIFKTPTKPKASKSSLQSEKNNINSPTKSKTTTTTTISSPKTNYVIANSPIKLRALVAAQARSSPNFRSGGGFNGSSSLRSPEKINNPFATGGSGLDQEMRSDESDDFFRGGRRSNSITPVKSSKVIQNEERGEGSDTKKVPAWESVFSGNSRIRGSSMSLDGNSTVVNESMDLDDEALGPSPIKPSANGKSKTFTPLLLDSLPSTSTSSATINSNNINSKSILFETSAKVFASTSSTSTSMAKPSSSKPSLHPTLLAQTRGIKRPGVPLELELERSFNEPNSNDEEEVIKGKGKINSTTVTKLPRKPKRTKFSTINQPLDDIEDDTMIDQDGIKEKSGGSRRINGELILEEEEGMSRAVIQSRSNRFRNKGKQKQVIHDDDDDDGVDGIPEDEDDEEENRLTFSGSLFYRNKVDLLSQSKEVSSGLNYSNNLGQDLDTEIDDEEEEEEDYNSNLRQTRSQPNNNQHHSITLDSTIPSDLVSLLSIRSSPIKKTSLLRQKERDLRVKKLLQEPSIKIRKISGLLDLNLNSDEEDKNETGENELGSDDDWDSDAEGWKDLGDGVMDGYDEDDEDRGFL